MSKSLKETLETLDEEAYRPADNMDNGELAPISLTADDFQEEVPLPVEPYLSTEIPVQVQDIDEKDFVQSNPALDAGYSVDPNVDNLGESAVLDRVGEKNGIVELTGTHNDESDEVASKKYEETLLAKNPEAKVLRTAGNGFVIVDKDGNTAQVTTKGGKHFARFSDMSKVGRVIEAGHASDVLKGTKLHEGADAEDIQSVLESAMEKLIKDSIFESNAKSEVSSMFSSQGLNEDVTAKTADLFEAAVNVAAKKHLSMLNAAGERYIAESLDAYHQTTQRQINEYLDHVINEWAEENRLALEAGARTQIAESFMDGLKGLLESHYVDLPEDKVDLYEQAIKTGDSVLAQLDEAKEKETALTEKLNKYVKSAIIESTLTGVVATKAERVRELAEAIDFVDEAQYKGRVQHILESVSGTKAPVAPSKALLEDNKPVAKAITEGAVDPEIAQYLDFLGRK